MHFGHVKRSVIYGWTISYLFILLIPVLVIGMVYYVSQSIIESEILLSNQLVVENMKDHADNVLRNVERFSLEVVSNKDVRDPLTLDTMEEESAYYRVYKAGRQMYHYMIFNDAVKLFYIHYPNIEYVVSSGTATPSARYFDAYLKAGAMDYADWLDTMGRAYPGQYLNLWYKDAFQGDRRVAAYLRSIPGYIGGNPPATLVVLLDLQEIIEGDSLANPDNARTLFVVDADGSIVAQGAAKRGAADFAALDLSGPKGSLRFALDGVPMTGVYAASSVNGWRYVIATPEITFWQKAQRVRNIMGGGLALCLVLGAVLSYYFIRRNYHPLKEVVSLFQGHTHGEGGKAPNEYKLLASMVDQTLQQNKAIQSKIDQQNRMLRDHFFTSLLKGRAMLLPVEELMATHHVSFPHGHFLVMTMYPRRIDEGWRQTEGNQLDPYALARFAVANVVEEWLGQNQTAYVVALDDMLVTIVNLEAEDAGWKVQYAAAIDDAKRFIEANLQIQVAIGVSCRHSRMDSLPTGFAEAMEAIEYINTTAQSEILFYDDIAAHVENQYQYDVEREYQLINCVRSGDFSAASALVKDVFRQNFAERKLSLEMAQCLMFALINTSLKISNEINKYDETFIARLNPAGELMKCKGYAELEEKLLSILNEACDVVQSRQEKTDYTIRDDVLAIIESQYHDANLSIVSIAESLGKYPYYVSKAFKKQTGEGILDAINRVRVQKAKELLLKGRMNHAEIADAVGFTSLRTFQRIFKKAEGTTPGKVKDLPD